MSKRRRPNADPTSLPATRIEDERIFQVLDTLSEREANMVAMRFGLDDGRPKTLDEISKIFGARRAHVHRLVLRALEKLRQPDLKAIFAEYDAEGRFYGTVDVRRRPALKETDEQLGIIRCPSCDRRFHPRTPVLGPRTDPDLRNGRPRKYCSNKCRQAAYRARRAAPKG